MSYEGRVQLLCRNGHMAVMDAYYAFDLTDGGQCIHCGEPFVWAHHIDDTNECGQLYDLEERQPAEYQVCNLGHRHCVVQAQYVIPSYSR